MRFVERLFGAAQPTKPKHLHSYRYVRERDRVMYDLVLEGSFHAWC